MSRAERRLDEILDILKRKPRLTRLDIEEELARRQELRLIRRGDQSEENVLDAVLDLNEIVAFAQINEHFSPEDMHGEDILTVLYGGDEIKIQVKSNEFDIKRFIKKRGEENLLKNSIIVINGQLLKSQIQDIYLMGLLQIDKFKGVIKD